ncbi:MAG: putative bifunctional diguanylate cyclase/phosphodiesterase [Granulosicoccus sp.]
MLILDKYIESIVFPLEFIRSPVWLLDVNSLRFVWGNSAALVLWDAPTLTDLQNRNLSADISLKVRKRLNQYCIDLTGTTSTVSEHWTFYPKGRPTTCDCSISAFESPAGVSLLMVNAIQQDSESSADTLYRSSALLHTSVCVSVYGTDGRLKYSNPAARCMLGAERLSLAERFVDSGDWRWVKVELAAGKEVVIEALVVTGNEQAWHSLTLESCPDPVIGASSIMVTETDVSERLQAEQQVHQLAYYDALTELPNRTSWFAALRGRLELARGTDERLAVLFVDLDRFKLINDTLGHTIGDKLLVAVSERLSHCLNSCEELARLGGDEFTLLLEDNETGSQANDKAQFIVETLTTAMNIDGHEISIAPSIGISRFPQQSSDADELMKQADLAMYAAKEAGVGYLGFKAHMTTQSVRRRVIERDLSEAISTCVLQVYYQPKLCAVSGVVLGQEALCRWNHPSLGWISPGEFIAVAEETGKIGEVTKYVLHEALTQQAKWAADGHDICMAVNVSPLEFRDGDIVDVTRQALHTTGAKPENLELEITESMLMEDSDSIQTVIAQLHTMRVKLSLDDFGSGYSNLGYLQKFPFDSIKIDRSFLSHGEISPVIDLIIGVGNKLSLKVVAEGVETQVQSDFLTNQGCHQLQGYLFAEPMDKSSATDFLNAKRKSAPRNQRQRKIEFVA